MISSISWGDVPDWEKGDHWHLFGITCPYTTLHFSYSYKYGYRYRQCEGQVRDGMDRCLKHDFIRDDKPLSRYDKRNEQIFCRRERGHTFSDIAESFKMSVSYLGEIYKKEALKRK